MLEKSAFGWSFINTRTRRTRYSENVNITFSCINLELLLQSDKKNKQTGT